MENSHTQKLHKACNDQKEVFIATLVGLHGLSKEKAESVWLRESGYFTNMVENGKDFDKATELSLKNAFSEIASNFVSLQPGPKSEAFLKLRNANIGSQQNPNWVKVCGLSISVYGELNMRLRAGRIIHAHNPIVLYEGDTFQPRTNENGKLIVEYSPKIPRTQGAAIFGCYIHLELPNGVNSFKWLLQEDIDRLRGYSERENRATGQANPLYTSNNGGIDTGFLAAKTLKHSMSTLEKLRVSDGVVFESEDDPISDNAFHTTAEETPGVEIPTGEQAASETDNDLF